MYTQKIMQHFLNPQNAGTIKKPDIVAKIFDEKNGEVVKIYLKINLSSNIIEDATFKTMGSPLAIACSDLLCDMLKQKSIDEVAQIGKQDIINVVGKENIPAEKMYSISNLEDAISEIIKIFTKKYL